jgi:hypothetical protein
MKTRITYIPELAELISLNSLIELKLKAIYDRKECYEAIEELTDELDEAETEEEIEDIVDDLILVHTVLDTIAETTQFVEAEFNTIGYRLN